MYHPTILKLDSAASDFHEAGMFAEKNAAHRLAGGLQQHLLAQSPYSRKRRFLHAQWVWALGHIGLLYQLIRWFRLHEPDTQLVLAADGAANLHFLKALAPFLLFTTPKDVAASPDEPMRNAVYFGCPDGVHSLVSFNKMAEAECRDVNLLELTDAEQGEVDLLLAKLCIKRPYVAFHARHTDNDQTRNVSLEQVADALLPYTAKGYSVVSTGLDLHPICTRYPSVVECADKMRASFLLSAACDQFVGSNSGAWTMAWAYRRPVTILNDHELSAWIYP